MFTFFKNKKKSEHNLLTAVFASFQDTLFKLKSEYHALAKDGKAPDAKKLLIIAECEALNQAIFAEYFGKKNPNKDVSGVLVIVQEFNKHIKTLVNAKNTDQITKFNKNLDEKLYGKPPLPPVITAAIAGVIGAIVGGIAGAVVGFVAGGGVGAIPGAVVGASIFAASLARFSYSAAKTARDVHYPAHQQAVNSKIGAEVIEAKDAIITSLSTSL